MRVKQTQFYRLTGIREKAQFTRPRLIPQRKLELPLESIIHYAPIDTSVMGPTLQEPLLINITDRKFVEHVTVLDSNQGNPRRTALMPSILQNEYRRKTRGVHPLRKDAALLINPRNVLVVNYAMLNPLYRYIQSFKANYFRWYNNNQTFWSKVAEINNRFHWNQYIEFQLPEVIPTLEQFKRFEAGLTQAVLDVFNTPQSLNLTDFWFWLGDKREQSAIAKVPAEAFEKINFIFRIQGYFFVLNLGVINEWRLDKEEENDTGLEGSLLQRRFIKLLNSVMDVMAGVSHVENDEEIDEEGPVLVEKKEAVLPESEPVSKDDFTLPLIDLDKPEKTVKETKKVEIKPIDIPTVRLPETKVIQTQPTIIDTPDTPSLVNAITDKAMELQENQLITVKAFNKIVEDAQRFKLIKDPYGSDKTLEEMLTISPEELVIPDVPQFTDRSTVVDKSMLSSKLKIMTQVYVKNILKRDVLNAVMSVQRQGVSVIDYKIDVQHDAMNHYEVHRVTLKPVRGRQSTVVFRLPVIDNDGRFISNGNKVKARLQRVDRPLRKISPTRVALTSYYNKTFVDRSERKVNNFDQWLINQVIEKGSNPDDTDIVDFKYSNVFDMHLELPRPYSTFAQRFEQIQCKEGILYFDYKNRLAFFEALGINVVSLEVNGLIVIGVKDTVPLLIDKNGTFYRKDEVIGTVFDVLGLDMQSAPLEIAEMTVSNATIPVGFVLAYQYGLTKLIEMLKCEVNRVKRGERIQYQPDDYTLVFQDQVLVFSRLDQRSAMIIAGLNRYHKSLKEFSAYDFDRKDVYFRLLNDAGLGVRYLREIESLFNAWVDPITEGLLKEMGEPTDFTGLLLRSVELLMSDYSPDEIDGAFMRYRGYERLAGFVFGELNRSVKQFNARIGSGENRVELNPHAIWQRIVNDPSVALVEEANPIQDLREQEVMTYRGDGGRSSQSMVERTRIFHDNDVGIVSESTVDSGDVGVVAYLSPDANFTNLRGITRKYDGAVDGSAKLLSSSALLAPCADRDDYL